MAPHSAATITGNHTPATTAGHGPTSCRHRCGKFAGSWVLGRLLVRGLALPWLLSPVTFTKPIPEYTTLTTHLSQTTTIYEAQARDKTCGERARARAGPGGTLEAVAGGQEEGDGARSSGPTGAVGVVRRGDHREGLHFTGRSRPRLGGCQGAVLLLLTARSKT
jgi:hypothetical protein